MGAQAGYNMNANSGNYNNFINKYNLLGIFIL